MFNVGDRVRVVSLTNFVGDIGTVLSVDDDPEFPYLVCIDDFSSHPLVQILEIAAGQAGVPFSEEELELVNV